MQILLLLAQAEADGTVDSLSEIVRLLRQDGFPFVVAALIIWFVVWYGPRLVRGHLGLLAKIEESTESQARTSEKNAQTYAIVSDTLSALTNSVGTKLDPRGDPKYDEHIFSKVSTNAAIKQALIGAKEAIKAEDPKEAVPFIQKAIDHLE